MSPDAHWPPSAYAAAYEQLDECECCGAEGCCSECDQETDETETDDTREEL